VTLSDALTRYPRMMALVSCPDCSTDVSDAAPGMPEVRAADGRHRAGERNFGGW